MINLGNLTTQQMIDYAGLAKVAFANDENKNTGIIQVLLFLLQTLHTTFVPMRF